jgi:hypothetical protein
MPVRPMKADIDKAIRKCWPVKKRDGTICLTPSEFEAHIDRIMAYISTSTNRSAACERNVTGIPVASWEMHQYLVERLSPQWARIIGESDVPAPVKNETKAVLPRPVVSSARRDDGYMRGPVGPLKWKSVR